MSRKSEGVRQRLERLLIRKGAKRLELPRFPDKDRIIYLDGTGGIKSVLASHKDDKLLLSEVRISGNMVTGYLTVMPSMCVGIHRNTQEDLVIRPSDIMDMAAQLLGMFGSLLPELTKRRSHFGMPRGGGVGSRAEVMVWQTIEMKILIDDIVIAEEDLDHVPGGKRHMLLGVNFIATVGGSKVATVDYVVVSSTPFSEEECERNDNGHKKV
jgi:hypothetical protein